MSVQQIWAWILANPITTFAIFVYLVANVAPRPHPDDHTGWKMVFWSIVDRLCWLTANKLPGALKLPLLASPSATAAPKTPDTGNNKEGAGQ